MSKGPGDEARSEVRREIFARQLTRLGVAFSPEDLLGHDRLRRVVSGRFGSDTSYVDWAEHWLLRLRAANGNARIYPEPFFDNLLREYWRAFCWNGGWLALPERLSRWRSSSLAGPLLPLLGDYAALLALRGWARCFDVAQRIRPPAESEPSFRSEPIGS
jgi:hypothetical protein